MKSDLAALASEHGLLSMSLNYFVDENKYSSDVQFMDGGERVCLFCERHTDSPDDAVQGAIMEKIKRDTEKAENEDAYRAERIRLLRATLEMLEAEQ